jgi:CDP-glycerol glycerophosphotransferase
MTEYIKLAVIFLLRIVFRLFYIFPINDKKILFNCYKGHQYSCNPKYIFEYLYGNYGDKYQYIWCLDDGEKLPADKKYIKIIKYLSLRYCFHLLTAKYYIFNDGINPIFPIRERQIVVNTWHGGGAYKKTGIESNTTDSKLLKIVWGIRSKMTKFIVSSCRAFTQYTAKDFLCPESKFLPIGMPRNDIFFDKSKYKTIKEKVYKYFNIRNKNAIVLYAPTYRGNHKMLDNEIFKSLFFSMNFEQILKTLNEKFQKDFLFLMRSHYVYYDMNIKLKNNIVSASDYPDMQELLCAADVLITDYSSSIWDFSFTHRPCFIYAPDVEKYSAEQGFYTLVEEWPFPLAKTNDELAKSILQFDKEKYAEAVKRHHADLGSYENGTATKQFYEKIFAHA